MSEQRFVLGCPEPALDTLAMSFYCERCRARRNFAIGTTLDEVTSRQLCALEIECTCETCDHRQIIAIGWTKREAGWTTRPLFDPATAVKIADRKGMSKEPTV